MPLANSIVVANYWKRNWKAWVFDSTRGSPMFTSMYVFPSCLSLRATYLHGIIRFVAKENRWDANHLDVSADIRQ